MLQIPTEKMQFFHKKLISRSPISAKEVTSQKTIPIGYICSPWAFHKQCQWQCQSSSSRRESQSKGNWNPRHFCTVRLEQGFLFGNLLDPWLNLVGVYTSSVIELWSLLIAECRRDGGDSSRMGASEGGQIEEVFCGRRGGCWPWSQSIHI